MPTYLEQYHEIVTFLGEETGIGYDAVKKFCEEITQYIPISAFEIAENWKEHFYIFGRSVDFRKSNWSTDENGDIICLPVYQFAKQFVQSGSVIKGIEDAYNQKEG